MLFMINKISCFINIKENKINEHGSENIYVKSKFFVEVLTGPFIQKAILFRNFSYQYVIKIFTYALYVNLVIIFLFMQFNVNNLYINNNKFTICDLLVIKLYVKQIIILMYNINIRGLLLIEFNKLFINSIVK